MHARIVAPIMLVFAACQPMYSAPAARMRDPKPIQPPKGLPGEVVKVTYVEDCEVRTSRTAAVKTDSRAAETLVRQGDTRLSTADRTPAPEDKGSLLTRSIEDYSAALVKDPFNAEATLKLARAYDKVLRKGCALVMLERLQKLADNPRYEPAATDQIDDVVNHRTWFEGYRKDALRAVGR